MSRSVKAQMKYADKTGARYTMVLGDDELARNRAELREMEGSASREADLGDIGQLADILKN